MSGGGGDQTAAMERLAQILYLLARAHRQTAPADRLLTAVAYGAEDVEDRRRQLARDVEQLRTAGWDVRNDGGAGEHARYRLVTATLGTRVDFPPDELAEMQRVARLAGLSRLADELARAPEPAAPDPAADGFVPLAQADVGPLDVVLHAVRRRCLLRFDYRGSRRTVHPHQVHLRAAGWYLTGREEATGTDKLFRVDRMSAAEADQPGTATAGTADAHEGHEGRRVSLDPVTWPEDPPVEALVDTTAEHRPQVLALLAAGAPPLAEAWTAEGGVRLGVAVTNRAAFRARLYELGERVRLAGPDELRDEVRADLLALAAPRATP